MESPVNGVLKGFLLLVSVFAVLEVGLAVMDARALIRETSSTVSELKTAAKSLREYSDEQISNLRSEKNKKAIDSAIQTVAVFNATGRLINTQVIPRTLKTLDNVDQSVVLLNSMIQETNQSLNKEVAPEVTKTLQAATETLNSTSDAVRTSSQEIKGIAEDIRTVVSDASIRESLENIKQTTQHMDEVSANISEASKRAISVADSVEKIAKTSAKYRKAILISQILSILSHAFF